MVRLHKVIWNPHSIAIMMITHHKMNQFSTYNNTTITYPHNKQHTSNHPSHPNNSATAKTNPSFGAVSGHEALSTNPSCPVTHRDSFRHFPANHLHRPRAFHSTNHRPIMNPHPLAVLEEVGNNDEALPEISPIPGTVPQSPDRTCCESRGIGDEPRNSTRRTDVVVPPATKIPPISTVNSSVPANFTAKLVTASSLSEFQRYFPPTSSTATTLQFTFPSSETPSSRRRLRSSTACHDSCDPTAAVRASGSRAWGGGRRVPRGWRIPSRRARRRRDDREDCRA